ncbi:MAG: hypothetical protein ABII01_01540 [Candidatus Woesearchaeota archaeon]
MVKMIHIFFVFFVFVEAAYALSIGVSPNQILINENNPERQLTLFNPNNFSVGYYLELEKPNDKIEIEKEGVINSFDSKNLRIKHTINEFRDYESRLLVKFFQKEEKDGIGIFPTASVKIKVEKLSDTIDLNKISDVKDENKIEKKQNLKTALTVMGLIIIIGIFIYLMIS